MRPLGPINSKNSATTISPWVVTQEALEDFKIQLAEQKAILAPYLQDPDKTIYDVEIEVEILADNHVTVVGKSNVSTMYWNVRQIVAQTTSAGSPLKTGDLLATGTISGTKPGTYCSLLEITDGAKNLIKLDDGTERGYLKDGDTVRMTAHAGSEDSGVGFGECVGTVVPARKL